MVEEQQIVERIKKFVLDVTPLSKELPCDYFAYTQTRRDQFYIIVKNAEPSSVEIQQIYEHYLIAVRNMQMARIPVVYYKNEGETLHVGILIYWDEKKSYLNTNVHWVNWSIENISWFNSQIHARRMQIDFLPMEQMYVIKRVVLNDDDIIDGMFVYLRKLTPSYKMLTSSSLTDKERYSRLFMGTPEEEYPYDTLDELIYSRVKEVFPKAERHSKLLLFHTDLLSLRLFKELNKNEQTLLIHHPLLYRHPVYQLPVECFYRQGFFKKHQTVIRKIDAVVNIPSIEEYTSVMQMINNYALISKMNI